MLRPNPNNPQTPRELYDTLTETQKKYFRHAFGDREGMIKEVRFQRAIRLPVCPKCEHICMRDRRPDDPPPKLYKDEFGNLVKTKPYVTCPHCGYHGPESKVPFRVHVKEVDPRKPGEIRVYT